MTLKDYYVRLGQPQRELRERIVKECGVSLATVYRWLSGDKTPLKLQREKIAEIIGVTVNDIDYKEVAK